MKVLVILGSPRKGESYSVMQKVEAQMKALGEVEFDYLWLRDIKFRQCTGCHVCIQRSEQKCPFRSDVADIETRMHAADGLIIVTPVYTQQVSYLVKILFDRFAYIWHRPRFFGKFAMGIAAGGGQAGPALNYIKENTHCWGYTYVTGISAQHPEALQPKMRAKLEHTIEKASRKFYETVKKGEHPAPSLFDLIWFRMWRMNARAVADSAPVDLNYWTEKGWLTSDYFTNKPVGLLKHAFGQVMEGLLGRFMRSVYKGY